MKYPILINVQEVHALRETQGLPFPEITQIKPPYPECALMYKPDNGTTVVSLVQLQEETVIVNSFVAAGTKTFVPFLFASLPLTFTSKEELRIQFRHEPNLKVEVAEESLGKTLFALNLMNCKNIKYVPFDPNSTLRPREKRSMRRNGEHPYLTYKVLEIQPMKPKSITKSNSSTQSIGMLPLHTVRGHFKSYSADSPLFGRLTGTFWWGPSIKGNPDIGIVEKDYRLLVKPSEFERLTSLVQGDSPCS